jgi:hypothetical protein
MHAPSSTIQIGVIAVPQAKLGEACASMEAASRQLSAALVEAAAAIIGAPPLLPPMRPALNDAHDGKAPVVIASAWSGRPDVQCGRVP